MALRRPVLLAAHRRGGQQRAATPQRGEREVLATGAHPIEAVELELAAAAAADKAMPDDRVAVDPVAQGFHRVLAELVVGVELDGEVDVVRLGGAACVRAEDVDLVDEAEWPALPGVEAVQQFLEQAGGSVTLAGRCRRR